MNKDMAKYILSILENSVDPASDDDIALYDACLEHLRDLVDNWEAFYQYAPRQPGT